MATLLTTGAGNSVNIIVSGGTTAVFEAEASSSGFGDTSWSSGATAPTAVAVGVLAYIPGGSPPSVTYDGVSMGAAFATKTYTATPLTLYIFGLANPNAGNKTVAVTANGAVAIVGISITCTGSDTSTCFRAASSNTATGTGTTLTATTTNTANDLAISILGNDAGGAAVFTATTGTQRGGTPAIGGICAGMSTLTATGSDAMSWSSDTSQTLGEVVAAFKHG